eukprot:3813380-Rhodomonas_salina.1
MLRAAAVERSEEREASSKGPEVSVHAWVRLGAGRDEGEGKRDDGEMMPRGEDDDNGDDKARVCLKEKPDTTTARNHGQETAI